MPNPSGPAPIVPSHQRRRVRTVLPVTTPHPRVLVLVLPRVNLLDLGGPVQVFDTASAKGAPYRLEFVADADAGQQTSAQGLALAGLGPLGPTGPDDLVLIPGPRLVAPTPGEPLVSAEVIAWLRAAADAGSHLASVCSGAAALGEAGLLDGRRCTTHWSLIEPMRHRYPLARVADDVLYVHDGPISTSAGVASGIDLALSLLERRHGPVLAAAVARQLVVHLRRPGNSAQLNAFLRHREHVHPAVHRVQDHLAADLSTPHSLAGLAAVAHLSPRGLRAAFARTIGMSPLAYLQELRLEHAATLLTETDLTVEVVAARCGWQGARQLRRVMRERLNVAPAALRGRAS